MADHSYQCLEVGASLIRTAFRTLSGCNLALYSTQIQAFTSVYVPAQYVRFPGSFLGCSYYALLRRRQYAQERSSKSVDCFFLCLRESARLLIAKLIRLFDGLVSLSHRLPNKVPATPGIPFFTTAFACIPYRHATQKERFRISIHASITVESSVSSHIHSVPNGLESIVC